MKMSRPDLVVPYQELPLRDKLYPYILTTAIVLATLVAVIMASMRGVEEHEQKRRIGTGIIYS